jgi:2-C-methyl-D-erythritol 2,4-cyclodiphosphate synthase
MYRTGIGYDAHRFAAGRPLVLGGVTVPHATGLEGWSDADVLTHSVMDAVLGAAAAGDIGEHFPPKDPAYKDASSLDLLAQVADLIGDLGFEVVNVDTVLIMDSPRVGQYRAEMAANIAAALGVEAGAVGVKATTTEGMGFSGRGEGAAAQAVALLRKP